MTTSAAVRRSRKPLLVVHIAASVGLMGAVASGVLIAIAAATDRVEATAGPRGSWPCSCS